MIISTFTILSLITILVKSSITPTGLFCTTGPNQSPINVNDPDTKFISEKFFRILFVNYNILPKGGKWTVNNADQSIQLGNSTSLNMGSLTIIKDYAMYQFNLNRILVRIPAENQLNGVIHAMELQLIHQFAVNNTIGGRKVMLNSNYLVISIFFDKNDTISSSTTSLFNYTNINDFINGNNVGFLRDIKMKYLINNMPSYLYEGSLTSGNCDPAIWILQSNFNFITTNDFNNLVSALGQISPGMSTNNRNIMGNTSTINVYKNYNSSYIFAPSLINYNHGSRMVFSSSWMVILAIIYISLMN